MATNEVYANNLEIACKAAVGKAIAAPVDVCMSPPPPSAGPIPIPYANTAYAKDTTKGSKTVFISGKPVVLKNKSYLKTSTGNEAATQAYKKGIISGVIKGKCYFAAWSANVKVESFNVCRHTDMTTHNHGSTSNGAATSYLDSAAVVAACEDDQKKIDDACGDPETNEWMENCPDLDADLALSDAQQADLDELSAQLEDVSGLIAAKASELADTLGMTPQEIARELSQSGAAALATKAETILASRASAAAAGSAGRRVVGKVALRVAFKAIPVVGWLSLAYDAYQLADYALSTSPQELVKQLTDAADLKEQVQGKIDELKAEFYGQYFDSNECLNARRCKLVPYKNNRYQSARESGKGCCPGQTAHHVIPKASFTRQVPVRGRVKPGRPRTRTESLPGWSRYNQLNAPSVCVEGRSHGIPGSSHKRIHRAYNRSIGRNNLMVHYDRAVGAGTSSHNEAFPSSRCDPACIEAQLRAYHDNIGSGRVRAINTGGRG